MNRTAVATLTAAACLATACVDRGIEPMAPEAEGITSVTGAASAVSSSGAGWVVTFADGGPANLDADVAALGGRVDFVARSLGFAVVSGISDEQAAALGAVAGVESAFPDVEVFLDAEPAMGEVEAIEAAPASIANPAGGIRFSYQWNMRRIGANAAWAAGALGSPDVTIAILDSGIDYDSYDMNGMVDLARSASFVPNDNAIMALFPTIYTGRLPIDDMNGHGTNVATQASSNATIFAGVNSRARLMAVKVLGYNGSGSLAGILAGLAHAADNGADVANMSLGIRFGVDKAVSEGFMGITNKAFNYANRKGMVIVVAAGNDAANMDNEGRIFRAYCEAVHVICVGATGPTASTNAFTGPWTDEDALASYSNFGRQAIDVSAPGGTNRGWVASVCARKRLFVNANGTVSFSCNAAPGFFVATGYAGTSQAAPHVAGVVAQLIAKHGRMKPSQTKHMLFTTALDDLGPAGADAQYGRGRVNLAKALGL
jgi:subtilisin family serine protease